MPRITEKYLDYVTAAQDVRDAAAALNTAIRAAYHLGLRVELRVDQHNSVLHPFSFPITSARVSKPI